MSCWSLPFKQMMEGLQEVARAEKINLPEPLAEQIVSKSDRNMRRALLLLEACHVAQYVHTTHNSCTYIRV